MKIVGERMRQLREEAGISQNKLAKLIGIQQSSLNRYESGFSNPTPETLLWFGDFFDVSMDYIFGRTDMYNYYQDTQEFHRMQYHTVPTRMSFSEKQMMEVKKVLSHQQEALYIYHQQERKKDESQVRFDDKCKAAQALGLLKPFTNDHGEVVDLPSEIIEIYGYRNAIHLVAEHRKGIAYELELSKKAYRRMQPFIEQIKAGLERDQKSIYR